MTQVKKSSIGLHNTHAGKVTNRNIICEVII